MRDTGVLEAALGLGSPWQVTACDFDAGARQFDIHLDFAEMVGEHDTRLWRVTA